MAKFESVGWFPIRSMYLRDDLPTLEEIAREAAGELMPPRKVLAIVAQFPESEKRWPYTFKGCHPVKEWRRPSADEMEKARKYYGESPNNQIQRTPLAEQTPKNTSGSNASEGSLG